MSEQLRITTESQKIKIEYGYIANFRKDVRKDYTIYKFNLKKTQDSEPSIEEYSSYTLPEIQEGMYIRFEYVKKGIYLNVLNVLDLKFTNEDPITNEKKFINDELISQYIKLYNTAVVICTNQNNLSDEEIKAQFIRLQKIMGLENLFKRIKKEMEENYL